MDIRVERRLPSPNEYLQLRLAAEWPVFPEDTVEHALSQSLFGVCVLSGDVVVGMGRVIGDGAVYFHVQDVIVNPKFQRTGIGRRIMTELMAYIEERAVRGAQAGLMCSKGREKFYHDFGFNSRPSEKSGAGMTKTY